VKLDEDDFEVAHDVSHPNISTVMDLTDHMVEVMKVLEGAESVQTANIIPLPIYLVPLFLNGGKPLIDTTALQVFMENFYETVPSTIKT